jgi:hypothetical protein
MIDVLEKTGYIILSWTTVSLLLAVGWSRFMSRLHCKELTLVIPERQRAERRANQVRSLARARLSGYAS